VAAEQLKYAERRANITYAATPRTISEAELTRIVGPEGSVDLVCAGERNPSQVRGDRGCEPRGVSGVSEVMVRSPNCDRPRRGPAQRASEAALRRRLGRSGDRALLEVALVTLGWDSQRSGR
jgi:hypothetical protein